MKLPRITDLPPEFQKPFADYIRSYRDWRLDDAPETASDGTGDEVGSIVESNQIRRPDR